MRELLEWGLRVAGGSLVALSVGSLWIPKALGWRRQLAGLSPLLRDMWWTYAAYVWGSHVFFAVLALTLDEWLMSRTPAAAAMSTFIFLWWAVRLGLQFGGFDLREVEDTWRNRVAKHLLTLLFIGLTTVFGVLVAWNAGWIPERS